MQDFNKLRESLRQLLVLPGPIEDGSEVGAAGPGGSIPGEDIGEFYQYTTIPREPEVVEDGIGTGVIKYPYASTESHVFYDGQFEAERHEREVKGVVQARYDFTYSGKVLITDIVNRGKVRLSGNGIENHLRKLNGALINA